MRHHTCGKGEHTTTEQDRHREYLCSLPMENVQQVWLHNQGFSQIIRTKNINWTNSKILAAHTVCPSCPQEDFSLQCEQRGLGAWISQHSARSLALGLQSTHFLTSQARHSNFLAMVADIQDLDQGMKLWQEPWTTWVPWARQDYLLSLTHWGQALGSRLKHSCSHGECCFLEFSCLFLLTVLGAPLEWQASVLAVDGVMWYVVQLHGVHGLAETCGAVLPRELFSQHSPLRATCVLQAIYVSRKPTDLPFQASNFFGYFSHRLKNFPEILH